MKNLFKVLVVSFLVCGLILSGCAEKKEKPKAKKTEAKEEVSLTAEKPPWDNFGYEKLNQFHLRYYYIFGTAIDKVQKGEMGWEEAIKDNTGIVEVWFKSDGSLFRLDRYIEKLDAKCKSYEGAPPDTISYNGKTYYLQERIIQKGKQFTSYTFHSGDQIGYDDLTKQAIAKSCRYEKFSTEKGRFVDKGSAIGWMMFGHVSGDGFGFYLNQKLGDEELDEDLEKLGEGALELTKMMNPAEYKKIIESWKVRKNIAGRAAVKDYGSPPSFRGILGIKGFQFIDLELGIGLEGYFEGFPKIYQYPEIKFDEPMLSYKALIVEKTVPPEVFEKF
ncbi:hypothetical protein AMJ44_06280 [candidate division WOR-1 bacterium DG_54_3]|uniref:Lipoprotein n=1 Tax=candidate division WOR-1 bacterium DG_54_3 TaxID=1703775 RepID=A0A0S7Y1F2_UNCSA|nr:MAG: hypothetical protein AMJ44_06280 [candidate division WOR-1 bacterium DG_54_3]